MTQYPYKSQWQTDAAKHRQDCGPAHVASILEAHGIKRTIDSIASAIDTADDGTTADDLAKVLRANGINAQVWTGTGYPKLPAVCLVKYSGFDRANVQDVKYTGWHWLLVHSINDLTAVVHDPDYWGERINEGAFKRYSRAEFDRAFIPYGASKIAVVWPEPEVATVVTNKYTIRDLNNNVLGKIEGAFTVTRDMQPIPPDPPPARDPKFTATPAAIVAGQTATLAWKDTDGASAVYLDGAGVASPGGKPVTPTTTTTYTLTVTYPEATIERKVTVTVTPVTDPLPNDWVTPVIGLNNVKDGKLGADSLANGCPSISTTFNPQAGGEFAAAYKDIHVAIRGLDPGGYVPTVDQWWGQRWQGIDYSGGARKWPVVMLGLNENDQIGDDAASIRARVAFDKAALAKCKAEGAKRGLTVRYAGGGFAVGGPNVLDRGIAEAMHGYGELLRDPDFFFNRHTYAADDHGADPSVRAVARRSSVPFTTPREFLDLFESERQPRLTVTGTRDLPFTNDVADWDVDCLNESGTWVRRRLKTFRVDWTIRRYALDAAICGWPLGRQWCVSDEGGLDIGSVGGLNACPGVDDNYIVRLFRRLVEIFSWPVTIDGVAYKSPMLWMNIFQSGDWDRWQGYDIRRWFALLKSIRWGQA